MNAMMLSSAATGLGMAGGDSISGNKLYREDDTFTKKTTRCDQQQHKHANCYVEYQHNIKLNQQRKTQL
jgi:hypothetical protein